MINKQTGGTTKIKLSSWEVSRHFSTPSCQKDSLTLSYAAVVDKISKIDKNAIVKKVTFKL